MRHSSANKIAGAKRELDAIGGDRGEGLPAAPFAPGVAGQQETADYVCSVLAGLRIQTERCGAVFLTYLLDVAYLEAANIATETHQSDPAAPAEAPMR